MLLPDNFLEFSHSHGFSLGYQREPRRGNHLLLVSFFRMGRGGISVCVCVCARARSIHIPLLALEPEPTLSTAVAACTRLEAERQPQSLQKVKFTQAMANRADGFGQSPEKQSHPRPWSTQPITSILGFARRGPGEEKPGGRPPRRAARVPALRQGQAPASRAKASPPTGTSQLL